MEEENKPEEHPEEQSPPQEESGIVEKIRIEREALEKTKEELKKENAKLQKTIAEAQMQGRSWAGMEVKQPSIKDKACEFFAGTEIAKAIERYG